MREVVFDTETTGLSAANGDRLVEIGCVELVNRVETGRVFHVYINPERPMNPEAQAIHGLSDAFLAANRSKPGITTLPSGIQYRVIEPGTGAKPTQASTVELQVAGPFPWGERPAQARPAQTIPGIKVSEVEMAAMREVLLQMPSGSKWEVTLPADKAYGADPRTGFPPNVAVQFELKLVSVK